MSIRFILQTISKEFPVFLREHQNGLYRTGTYFLSRIMCRGMVIFMYVQYWTFNSCTKCSGSLGIIHFRTLDCSQFP